MATRKGLWIALGTCGVVAFAGAAFIGIVIFAVVRHLEIRPLSNASAEQEYGQLRDRFAGGTPLIEIDRDNPGRIQVHRPAERPASNSITALHIFAWNPRDRKVVRLDVPLWLLRLQPRSNSIHWNWSGDDLDLEDIRVTVEDLERHGPGLVLDFEGHRGERLLVWSE